MSELNLATTLRYPQDSLPLPQLSRIAGGVKLKRRSLLSFLVGGSLLLSNPTHQFRTFNFIQSSNAAVDPMTVIAIAQGVMSAIKMFSSQSDGGLAAMLQANIAYQRLITAQLDLVLNKLADLGGAINDLKTFIPESLAESRATGYYERINGQKDLFKECYLTERNNPDSREELISRYKNIADNISDARGDLSNHTSLIAAVALPVCLGLEVAATRKARQEVTLKEMLNTYSEWAKRILDPSIQKSAAGQLDRWIKEHAELTSKCNELFIDKNSCSMQTTQYQHFKKCWRPLVQAAQEYNGEDRAGNDYVYIQKRYAPAEMELSQYLELEIKSEKEGYYSINAKSWSYTDSTEKNPSCTLINAGGWLTNDQTMSFLVKHVGQNTKTAKEIDAIFKSRPWLKIPYEEYAYIEESLFKNSKQSMKEQYNYLINNLEKINITRQWITIYSQACTAMRITEQQIQTTKASLI